MVTAIALLILLYRQAKKGKKTGSKLTIYCMGICFHLLITEITFKNLEGYVFEKYNTLTLKESLGVPDHSKKFCTPKNNVLEKKDFITNDITAWHLLILWVQSHCPRHLISFMSSKIYVYCQSAAKRVHGFNTFLGRSQIFMWKKAKHKKKIICL